MQIQTPSETYLVQALKEPEYLLLIGNRALSDALYRGLAGRDVADPEHPRSVLVPRAAEDKSRLAPKYRFKAGGAGAFQPQATPVRLSKLTEEQRLKLKNNEY